MTNKLISNKQLRKCLRFNNFTSLSKRENRFCFHRKCNKIDYWFKRRTRVVSPQTVVSPSRRLAPTLLSPSIKNMFYAYHHAMNHLHLNIFLSILSSYLFHCTKIPGSVLPYKDSTGMCLDQLAKPTFRSRYAYTPFG